MNRMSRAVSTAALALAAAALTVSCLFSPVAFSPDGKRFAAVLLGDKGPGDKPSELWVTEIETGESRMIGKNDAFGAPAWSPDGKSLYYLAGSGHKEFALERWDGAGTRELGQIRLEGDSQSFALAAPQVSPDGRFLYLADAPEKEPLLIRWDLETGERRALGPRGGSPALSPDGKRLAFLQTPGGKQVDLAVVPVEGGEAVTLAGEVGDLKDVALFAPAWSPDGASIAFVAEVAEGEEGDVEVWVVGADGKGRRRLSEKGEGAFWPVWSADSKSVFYSAKAGKEGAYRVRRVRAHGGEAEDPSWGEGVLAAGRSPDGRWLALRVPLVKPDASDGDREASAIRLIDLARGTTKDFLASEFQFLALARTELLNARAHTKEGRAEEAARALARALEALERMEKRFPDSGKLPEASAIREEIAKEKGGGG